MNTLETPKESEIYSQIRQASEGLIILEELINKLNERLRPIIAHESNPCPTPCPAENINHEYKTELGRAMGDQVVKINSCMNSLTRILKIIDL